MRVYTPVKTQTKVKWACGQAIWRQQPLQSFPDAGLSRAPCGYYLRQYLLQELVVRTSLIAGKQTTGSSGQTPTKKPRISAGLMQRSIETYLPVPFRLKDCGLLFALSLTVN